MRRSQMDLVWEPEHHESGLFRKTLHVRRERSVERLAARGRAAWGPLAT